MVGAIVTLAPRRILLKDSRTVRPFVSSKVTITTRGFLWNLPLFATGYTHEDDNKWDIGKATTKITRR